MNYLIDANIFLRLIVKENEQIHRECEDFFNFAREALTDDIYTTDLIIAEVSWVLSRYYSFEKKSIVKALDVLVIQDFIKKIADTPWEDALSIYSKHNVKLIDASTAAIIHELGPKNWAVVSYDKDFDKLSVKRLEPKDVLR